MKITRKYSRREFIRTSSGVAAGLILPAPTMLTLPRSNPSTELGALIFAPHFVQRGAGPHLLDWAYASDPKWDAFHSNIASSRDGVAVSDTNGEKKFGINVRWNVEDFGYIYITADNGGEFYELPPRGKEKKLNLNFELARSRVLRNRRRLAEFMHSGWAPSRETEAYLNLANELYEDARKITSNESLRARLAQTSLGYAMWGSEMMEMDKARDVISRRGWRKDFFFGCDARAFYQMYQDHFLEWFPQLFNYAMITYVIKGDGVMSDFEPVEGKLNFDARDVLFRKLRERAVTPQGRTLFWFYRGKVSLLQDKSYDGLRKYVEQHTRDTIAHYPEGMYGWEIFNEFHDWAVEVDLTPEQTVELAKLACDVAKATNPKVRRIINNCCPFAEYVQLKRTSGREARYRQRTPWEFTRDLVDAGVDFTTVGQQMYFPYRDLQDIIVSLERLEVFHKHVQLSEVGVPGGPSNDGVKLGKTKIPSEPHSWHRAWDEELQADWLEGALTLSYSKPWIESWSWFDFIDRTAYLENGGLLRGDGGEKKAAWHRLEKLQNQWKQQRI